MLDAYDLAAAAQFVFADLTERCRRGKARIGNLTHFAACRTQQPDSDTRVQRQPKCAGDALLVVGMGVAGQDRKIRHIKAPQTVLLLYQKDSMNSHNWPYFCL